MPARYAMPTAPGAWLRSGIVTLLLACAAGLATSADAASALRTATSDTNARGPTTARRVQVGVASVYARMLHGRRTASGERHDSSDLTAAHRTLPLGSAVRVTNLANDRSVVVRINDRGPNVRNRIVDLSPAAAAEIGLRARGRGLARVRLEVLDQPAVGVARAKESGGTTEAAADAPPPALLATVNVPAEPPLP